MSLTSSILDHSTVVNVLDLVLTGQQNFQTLTD